LRNQHRHLTHPLDRDHHAQPDPLIRRDLGYAQAMRARAKLGVQRTT
jgi:hypothetical protein